MDRIACNYFDGVDSTAHAAMLSLIGDQLHIAGVWGSTTIPVSEIKISDRLGTAPRTISLPGGAACELAGGAETNEFLAQFAPRESLWFRAQFDWRLVAASVVALFVLAFAGYRWGVPLATDFIANRLPDVIVQKISDIALGEVDRTVLNPSKLPDVRQKALAERFAQMKTPGGAAINHRVEFRDAKKFIGPNAFALPSGSIVMTDQLVELMKNDEQIMGVLSHELGHVHHKHGMRNVIQASFVGAAIAYWIGDFSSVIAGGATAVLQTNYSREYETEADDFGAAMMRANGMSGEALASALETLESEGRTRGKSEAAKANAAKKSGESKSNGKSTTQSDWSDYISTHPSTPQRVERLRNPPP
jgi:Zn-dependent protease with chaperone function